MNRNTEERKRMQQERYREEEDPRNTINIHERNKKTAQERWEDAGWEGRGRKDGVR